VAEESPNLQGESLNVRGAYLHAFTDAIQSAAIVVVGLVMWTTGFWLLDPLASVLIAALLFWSGGQILWEASSGVVGRTVTLRRLKALRVVQVRQAGRHRYYQLDLQHVETLLSVCLDHVRTG
jgi:cobalt-zinc-cadmium efflux system protein